MDTALCRCVASPYHTAWMHNSLTCISNVQSQNICQHHTFSTIVYMNNSLHEHVLMPISFTCCMLCLYMCVYICLSHWLHIIERKCENVTIICKIYLADTRFVTGSITIMIQLIVYVQIIVKSV